MMSIVSSKYILGFITPAFTFLIQAVHLTKAYSPNTDTSVKTKVARLVPEPKIPPVNDQ